MKKKIHKIWGVGLVVVLAASLLLAAAPVSAGTLAWGTEVIPSSTSSVLASGSEIADIAVSADGTIYAVTGTDNRTYKSTNGGASWSKCTKEFTFDPDLVAVAPDDSDVVAVAEATTPEVWISTNGGSTWGDLSNPKESDGTIAGTLTDLAISPDDAGVNYVAAAGFETTGPLANVWWFNVGAAAPAWKETNDKDGFGTVTSAFSTTATTGAAVAFSPNFASDKVMTAVIGDATNNTTFEMFSLSTKKWNNAAGFGSGYPAEIKNDDNSITNLTAASISLAPDYLGSDDSMRVAFVGISATTESLAGIVRMKDTTDKVIKDDVNIYSVSFDGTNLVAGRNNGDHVYRSSDPLATTPTLSTASSTKRPGTGGTETIVAWRGSDVVAGATGTGSAFAVSRDDGKSFNDISLVDTAGTNLGAIDDVVVSADGSVIYLLARDANAVSLWRKASSWERVFSVATTTGYIVRIAPDDPDSVYLAKTDASTIYYSQAGGDTKWFTRTSRYDIQDMAVESADVAYVAVNDAATVSKTTNSGFTWGSEKATGLAGGYIHMIASLGEDNLIVGSTTGYVAWSTDGNSSWSKVNKQLDGATLIQVTASGLADGDYIYAAGSTASKKVERWEIGQSGTSWKDLSATTTNIGAFGIALVDGVLYVACDNATGQFTLRTLSPDSGEPSSGMWSTMTSAGERFNRAPQALNVSAGSTKLWAADSATPSIYVYTDTLAEAGPTVSSPRDGLSVEMNPVSGVAYDVALTWERPSKGKIYDYQIALDSGFSEKVVSLSTSSTTSSSISEVITGSNFMPDTTYYWRIRVNIDGPVRSPWSEVRTFTIGSLPEAVAPVVIEQPPAPVIQVPPAPAITITPPEIVLPPSPAPVQPPEIVIPPAPAAAPAVPGWALWAIIIIGAVLVIALIVLIMRTRRPI